MGGLDAYCCSPAPHGRATAEAAIQRLFATAKLNGLDPARWPADTLEKLPTCPNSQIDSLPPFTNFPGNEAVAEGGAVGRLPLYCLVQSYKL